MPRLRTSLNDAAVRDRLDAAARKGRLPGLRLDAGDALFEVQEFGRPFESTLRAEAAPAGAAQAGAARDIVFSLRLKPLFPSIFVIILVVSIWPGIYLVDSMLKQYFSWYDSSVETWWWYLPLTVPTSPWAFWSAAKKSRASAHAECESIIRRLATELGADVVR
jgi:hypothetical protein